MASEATMEEGGALEHSVGEFVGKGEDYYQQAFVKIQSTLGFAYTFNWAAAILGPIWAAARNLWGFFWIFSILELIALVQLGRGLWGDLGADELARAGRLAEKAEVMREKAEAAVAAQQDNAEALATVAANLQKAAEKAQVAADAATTGALTVTLIGLGMLLVIKAVEGFYANVHYEHRYTAWRADPSIGAGFSMPNLLLGLALLAAMVPLTLYRFTASKPAEVVTQFPVDKDFYNGVATWLDESFFDRIANAWSGVFDGITAAIRGLLDGLELILVGTPWMVSLVVIVAIAWRLAGVRVAIFTAAGLAYLGIFGFWEKSMITVALLGAAALLCILIGIPLGIWCGKNNTVYTIVRPILDFMQTMPAFVYLIPVIAFFGTGKPPGILATVIFGMPPVVRLTALGIKGVPENIKEAALAFGCNKRKLLFDVELPLATPSIMTGVNQTILMCLSMVVIASLIGAEGLGSEVLLALQYAAKGQGLLAGLAILFCAMIIDRIVQGRFQRAEDGR